MVTLEPLELNRRASAKIHLEDLSSNNGLYFKLKVNPYQKCQWLLLCIWICTEKPCTIVPAPFLLRCTAAMTMIVNALQQGYEEIRNTKKYVKYNQRFLETAEQDNFLLRFFRLVTWRYLEFFAAIARDAGNWTLQEDF